MISSDSSFKEAVFKALCACFNLNPSSSDAKSFIREAYKEPENNPRPARTTDVLYWSVDADESIDDNASYNEEATTTGNHKTAVHRNLPYRLQVVVYGSNCVSNAHKVRSYFFLDGNNMPRSILRKAGIFPVPNPPKPTYLFEPEGSLWRRRVDQLIELLVADKSLYSAQANSIQVVPAVIINR